MRTLTHDEHKAAEAAFRGEPFNASWSLAAYAVYVGIRNAIETKQLQLVKLDAVR
jgi:hypothetical protein